MLKGHCAMQMMSISGMCITHMYDDNHCIYCVTGVKHLDLSYCPRVVDVSPLHKVYDLDLSCCESIVDVSSLVGVHRLCLSHCTKLTQERVTRSLKGIVGGTLHSRIDLPLLEQEWLNGCRTNDCMGNELVEIWSVECTFFRFCVHCDTLEDKRSDIDKSIIHRRSKSNILKQEPSTFGTLVWKCCHMAGVFFIAWCITIAQRCTKIHVLCTAITCMVYQHTPSYEFHDTDMLISVSRRITLQ